MPVLVRQNASEKKEIYRLEFEKKFRIGRNQSNDLLLDTPKAADFHAEIETDDECFILTDQFSKTGTFVNNRIVLSRQLQHKDVISIGGQRLLFLYEKGEKQPSISHDFNTRETIAIDTRRHRNKLVKNLLRLANQEKVDKKTAAIISFTNLSRPPFTMENDEITLGRSRRCDIRIKGFFLGKTAARIRKRGVQYFLIPGEGFVKPKLNYQTVKSETLIKELDVIGIGSCEMQFRYKDISE